MKIAKLSKTMTMRQLKELLDKFPWCKAKVINGNVWLVRCGYVSVSYPIIEALSKASLNAI